MPKIALITAFDLKRGIGFKNALPWPEPIPADWEYLHQVTKGKKMIMGRKSYDNPHRVWSEAGNFVLTRQANYSVDSLFTCVSSLEQALAACQAEEEVFVIGGQQVFEMALPLCQTIHCTHVLAHFESDTFFPNFDLDSFTATSILSLEKGLQNPYPIEIIRYDKK
ncbi:MAG: dihydrofolate reductase [Spirosomataceae bacterium]